jgi:hypothetical protein
MGRAVGVQSFKHGSRLAPLAREVTFSDAADEGTLLMRGPLSFVCLEPSRNPFEGGL